MDQNLILGLASPYRHEQGLQHDVRGLAALHCPANHPAGIEIDDDCKVGEARAGPDIGDVHDPGLVRSLDVELPVERSHTLIDQSEANVFRRSDHHTRSRPQSSVMGSRAGS